MSIELNPPRQSNRSNSPRNFKLAWGVTLHLLAALGNLHHPLAPFASFHDHVEKICLSLIIGILNRHAVATDPDITNVGRR